MKHELSKERLTQLADENTICKVSWDERIAMARALLAAREQEPVAYAWVGQNDKKHLTKCEPESWRGAKIITPLYTRHAPSIQASREPDAWQFKALNGHWMDLYPDAVERAKSDGYEVRGLWGSPPGITGFDPREDVRKAHAEWSNGTFGDVGPVGPLKHLAKESIEAAENPEDLSEWADCQFLLWDAQRRAGITDEQIAAACVDKLAVNKARTWPEPKDGEPRLHVKDGAPSIPAAVPDGLRLALSNAGIAAPESDEMLFATHEKYIQMLVTWVKDRKPLLPAPVPAVSDKNLQETFESWYLENWKRQCAWAKDYTVADVAEKRNANGGYDGGYINGSWEGFRAAMLRNSLVIPDGYVLVPIEPTENMVIEGFESEPALVFSKPDEWDAYQAMSGCEQAAHRARLCWAAMLAAALKEALHEKQP